MCLVKLNNIMHQISCPLDDNYKAIFGWLLEPHPPPLFNSLMIRYKAQEFYLRSVLES